MKPQSVKDKPLVYFDANALNFFCDEFRGRSKRLFKYYDIPLSWPQIDEIECNSSFARTVDLSDFAWQVSNRKVFLTVKDLVAMELESLLGDNKKISLSNYYDSDLSYLTALNEARKGITPNQKRKKLRDSISKEKLQIQRWEQGQREKWSSHFGGDELLPNDWSQLYALLIEERYFNQVLYGMVETYGLSNRFSREDIMGIDHRNLPALSIGIEFYVALQFLIDSQSNKLGKPDRGDLTDMQHAFYAGLCNYFVTNDARVKYILSCLVNTNTTIIIGCETFCQKIESL